ncbi:MULTISPECIES: HNH endonuclease [unclassified Microcoleus]|uniref:HNH endonuclease n=1 Tax=unclassified Microcoleus TaxID=2642155 RepID=UPI002FD50DC6
MTYKTVYLHRMVAEQTLDRKLSPGEVVHHLDEDISNNSPENLVICSSPSVHGRYHVRSLRQKLEADRPRIQEGDLWL